MAKHWTKQERIYLLQGVGSNGLAWLRRHGGSPFPGVDKRSAQGVYAQLDRMSGPGGLTRGSYTLNALIRITGYDKSHLKRAMRALHQKWKRTSPKGSFMITEDQFQELVSWLGLDYWSKFHHLYKCLWCYTRSTDHRSYGLCSNCYMQYDSILRSLGIQRSIKGMESYVKDHLKGRQLEMAMSLLGRRRALSLELLGNLP